MQSATRGLRQGARRGLLAVIRACTQRATSQCNARLWSQFDANPPPPPHASFSGTAVDSACSRHAKDSESHYWLSSASWNPVTWVRDRMQQASTPTSRPQPTEREIAAKSESLVDEVITKTTTEKIAAKQKEKKKQKATSVRVLFLERLLLFDDTLWLPVASSFVLQTLHLLLVRSTHMLTSNLRSTNTRPRTSRSRTES
jgi:hypothetical protein